MANKTLYIVAYDITEPKRLNNARYFIKNYSTGGQKSVFECFLTDSEKMMVLSSLSNIIDSKTDRVHIFSLDGRSKSHTLGIAIEPSDPDFFYFG